MTTATKKRTSEMVKRAAIIRFLEKDADEVDRMIREDGLPVVEIPGPNKPGVRIFLPDFHEWLKAYAKGSSGKVKDYAEFLRAFHACQDG